MVSRRTYQVDYVDRRLLFWKSIFPEHEFKGTYNEFYESTLSKYRQRTMHYKPLLKQSEMVWDQFGPLTYVTTILLLKCIQLPQYSPKTSGRVLLWCSIIELTDISIKSKVLWYLCDIYLQMLWNGWGGPIRPPFHNNFFQTRKGWPQNAKLGSWLISNGEKCVWRDILM